MLEMLAYDFMQRSLLAAAQVGLLCSVIGVFVIPMLYVVFQWLRERVARKPAAPALSGQSPAAE